MYRTELHDGYDSDYTANTNNLEGTYCFVTNTEYDINGSVNSNDVIEGTVHQPKFDLVLADYMLELHNIGLLKEAANTDNQLLLA